MAAVFLTVLGCGGSGNETGAADSSGAPPATSSTGPGTTAVGSTTGDSPTLGSTTLTPTTDNSTGDPGDESAGFAGTPDLPGPGVACDPWQDPCPPGEKCKPYSIGNDDYSDASCVPIADPPTPTGEACYAPMASFTDSCERGATCDGFHLSPESWRCMEMCTGSPAEPKCAGTCSRCVILGNNVAGICMLTCDPRTPDCAPGQSCVALPAEGRFLCGPAPATSFAGETCLSVSYCAEGTACVDAALVPGCAGEQCCAPICDLGEADTCATAVPGTVCAPWPDGGPDFEAACVPAGLGLCVAA